MTDVEIASGRDAAVLASLHARTVTVAYRAFFPAHSTAPTAAELEVTWAQRLADPTARAFVAFDGGVPVGSVMIRRDPDVDPDGQVVGLHVLPERWRRGIGGALHDAAITALTASGYQSAGLWVLAVNRRAREMYESRGWGLVPGLEIRPSGPVEVRYRRRLAGDLAG